MPKNSKKLIPFLALTLLPQPFVKLLGKFLLFVVFFFTLFPSEKRTLEAVENKLPEQLHPLYRNLGPNRKRPTAAPFIQIQFGAAPTPAGQNYLKRSAVLSPSGVLHVAYLAFTGSDNVYRYNALNCTGYSGTMKFSAGFEPPLQGDLSLLGGLRLQPSTNLPLLYCERRTSSSPVNIKCDIFTESSECEGSFQISPMTLPAGSSSAYRQPTLFPVSKDTFIATYSHGFNWNEVAFNRTTDGGKTWSAPTPITISPWDNVSAITGSGNLVYIVLQADPTDTSAFFTTEHPCYLKSTDGGATWSPLTDITGYFEYPEYFVIGISIEAQMVGDTLHVFWLDWDKGSGLHPGSPGGHAHHVAVFPDGAIDGPHKVADIPIDGSERTRSTSLFALAQGPWLSVSSTYRPQPSPVLYCLWSAPPDNGAGGFADSTDPSVGGGIYFGNFDIFYSASKNNGRTWDSPVNITQTNASSCDGTIIPCYSEEYFTAAETADSVIYILAKTDAFPGFQSIGDPGPDTRLQDGWRLYLAPARDAQITCATAIKGDMNDDGRLTPADMVLELICYFLESPPPLGNCACDLDCDGSIGLLDITAELNAVFIGMPLNCL